MNVKNKIHECLEVLDDVLNEIHDCESDRPVGVGVTSEDYIEQRLTLLWDNLKHCHNAMILGDKKTDRNKLNREISKLKKVTTEKEEVKEIIKVQCQFCGEERNLDLGECNLMDYDEHKYNLNKSGKTWSPCEACNKATRGWKQRTATCPHCDKLARYTANEKFVECFGCGRKA